MKFIRILLFSLFFVPVASFASSSEFMMAAQLLAAAKNADIQQVQSLVNAGADVNFVDSTGLSIVCTALMNNDVRAAQILQMYGADASRCDSQIKKFNNRTKPKPSGGLFSGLSSAQSLTLTAAGAAVVVGGLFLLTDVFDPGNDNESSGNGGNRPNNNPNNNGGAVGGGNLALSVPYSPAYLAPDGKITTSDAVYQANLKLWDPSGNNVRTWDFNYFRPTVQTANNYLVDGIDVPVQNYLLMMHGYSAFANDYMGQEIFRNADTRNPVLVGNKTGGGRPVAVAMVTDNGLNPAGSAARGEGISYAKTADASAPVILVDKYLNYNNPTKGTGVLGTELAGFDFSGSGTAMNPFANAYQNSLPKIVAGWYGTTNDLTDADVRSYGDFFGFVPNAQLGIYRTGAGKQWVDVANPTGGTVVGNVTDNDSNSVISAGDTIVLNGVAYKLSLALADTTITNPIVTIGNTTYKLDENSMMLIGKCAATNCTDDDIAIYQGTDKYYYVNTAGGDTVDSVYVMSNNNLYVQKELQNADYKNFEALFNTRAGVDVIANASVLDVARSNDYKTITDMPAFMGTSSLSDNEDFIRLINSVYEQNNADVTTQGAYANQLFNAYGISSPILIMPAGEFTWNNGMALDATFENYVPVLYGSNMTNRFMTVVAVQHANGTAAAKSIGAYGDGTGSDYGPLYLSMYSKDVNNTPDDTSDDIIYSSRKCGVAGTGVGSIDPWCFAAAGATAEMATAAAAGAVASVQAAFEYMTTDDIYQLLALTADGYLLGTDASGVAFNKETLAAYLKNMYALPPEYYANNLTPDKYLEAFAETYGYGLINLERATTPGKSIYFYDGRKIVSADGNAYWRAASNTVFKPSTALNLRGASISAPFFDIVESVDGKISLPRVWENEFAFDSTDVHGLYMGDVLGDLKTTRDNQQVIKMGNLNFSMAVSERAYEDYMGGLDNLSLSYGSGSWNFGASYQRYLTDGVSRFSGLQNPIMGLVSNAVVSDVEYNVGNWAFGGRLFSGAITDEALLENDPTISSQYMPARLGLMTGADSYAAWANDNFALKTSFGIANETDTLLGAYTDGLLNLGAGKTMYTDIEAQYKLNANIDVIARATFAKTSSDATGNFILGLSDVYSNAFAFGANIGNFEFSVSQPLAINSGAMKYAYAKYEVDADSNLNIVDTYIADLSLKTNVRETRFMGTYRHKFGEFTDGAFGFIYRINPNHTDEFGNESIFMMKINHRLGI
jgi:hypothetical protein